MKKINLAKLSFFAIRRNMSFDEFCLYLEIDGEMLNTLFKNGGLCDDCLAEKLAEKLFLDLDDLIAK